jgi:hypothetical protein
MPTHRARRGARGVEELYSRILENALNPLQIGELFHQLLHAMAIEHNR